MTTAVGGISNQQSHEPVGSGPNPVPSQFISVLAPTPPPHPRPANCRFARHSMSVLPGTTRFVRFLPRFPSCPGQPTRAFPLQREPVGATNK